MSIFRNRTNTGLIVFKSNNIPSNITDSKEQLQYLTGIFKNLDTFCTYIVQNYIKLKTYINKEYNIYFDENGNLKPELQQQAQQN